MHAADRHDRIRVHGARVNNLRDVTVELPKRRLSVFTGVSGSGKSSLAFHTIAAESQRLINETYSTFVQGFMPQLARPEVDVLDGLTTAIVVDQERVGGDARSTVGTVTDTHALLRILFSRVGQPHIGPPSAFSFNVASVSASGSIKVGTAKAEKVSFSRTGGMCPGCEGLGRVPHIDLDEIYDPSKSLNEGAITVPTYTADGWMVTLYTESGLLDPDKPIRDYSEQELHDFLHHEGTRLKIGGINRTYEGLLVRLQSSMFSKDRESLQPHIRRFVDRAATFVDCPDCDGTRLAETARSATIRGRNIAELCRMEVRDLAAWVAELDEPSVGPLVAKLRAALDAFVRIGLGYLSLERPTGTLSGGEGQRVKMVRHLGSALTDVTYVFDEPTTGLHPHDIQRMNDLLLALRDKGNTVLVVEHEPRTIAVADHVVDLGPGAGTEGGTVCYEGDVAGLRTSDTVTGHHLDDRASLKDAVREPTGVIEVRGASTHNLQDVDVDIPLGVLVVVTGVAGSGKSSLVHGSLPDDLDVVAIDQTPIRGSRRSYPATYTGLLDPIRKAFAKANDVSPALFSANSEGACPTCNGNGAIDSDLPTMATVAIPCEDCEGRRFRPEVLVHTLGGTRHRRGAGDVRGRRASLLRRGRRAHPRRPPDPRAAGRRGAGLPHPRPTADHAVGWRAATAEAGHPHGRRGWDLRAGRADSGLHLADVDQLLRLLDRLVDDGTSVIVVEHHEAVMAHADWIVDLGPGAGHDGGRVVFEGTPADLVADASTLTGQALAAYVAD